MAVITRSRLEAAWRIVRLTGLAFAHGSWAAAVVHSSTSAKLGAAAAAVGVSEAVYRRVFPQGSRRVSGWVARALVIVQKLVSEAPAVEAVDPKVAPVVRAVVSDAAAVEQVIDSPAVHVVQQ